MSRRPIYVPGFIMGNFKLVKVLPDRKFLFEDNVGNSRVASYNYLKDINHKIWDSNSDFRNYKTDCNQDPNENQTETQTCPKCGKTYPLTEEFFSKNQSTNTGGKKYFRPECKPCNHEQSKLTKQAFTKAGNPERPIKGYNSKTKKTENGYPCDCCGKTSYSKQIVFDHDHDTLEHRGWVCDSCNRGLGYLGDNVEGILNAFLYLNKIPKEERTPELIENLIKQLEPIKTLEY